MGAIRYKDTVMGRPASKVLAAGQAQELWLERSLPFMKRYTGQKALYEAIAKTQAKLQRRGILDRLRPGSGQEQHAQAPEVVEAKPQVEPVSQPVAPLRPPVEKPVEKPVAEKPPAPVVKPVRPVEHSEPQP